MTEITRQHLEDAALAAGHRVVHTLAEFLGEEEDAATCGTVLLHGVQRAWRPHLGDGDAARLAVRIMMMIDCDEAGYCHAIHGQIETISVSHDCTRLDKMRAWREAVVLCAAEVGRQMREGVR